MWFQLQLIASRHADQETPSTSYEDVILTLAPLDQAVLRLVVFTIGGLTVATLVALLQATNLRARPDSITSAIRDLASLGLIVVNGERADRVRVEHELVAQVVTEITPIRRHLPVWHRYWKVRRQALGVKELIPTMCGLPLPLSVLRFPT